MPHNAASDQVLHCLLTECSIKCYKNEIYHPTILKTNGLVKMITAGHSKRHKWVKGISQIQRIIITSGNKKKHIALQESLCWF